MGLANAIGSVKATKIPRVEAACYKNSPSLFSAVHIATVSVRLIGVVALLPTIEVTITTSSTRFGAGFGAGRRVARGWIR